MTNAMESYGYKTSRKHYFITTEKIERNKKKKNKINTF